MRRRFALVVFAFLSAQVFAQSTWHVSTSGSAFGGGTTSSPFASIQQAIAVAQSGDTVEVAAGTYFEHLNFSGKDVTVQSTDGAAYTIIDGSNIGPVVLFIGGETANAVLDGFTITHGLGNLALNGLSACAGGIHIWNSSPTVKNCIVTNNAGGATTNFTLAGTGGIELVGSHATISRCRIQTNTGGTGSNGGAGGIRTSGPNSAPQITDCIVANNVAAQAMAGGIQVSGGAATIDRCRVENNTGGYAGAGGIGVTGASTTPTIRDTFVQANTGGVGAVPPFFSPNAAGPGGIMIAGGQVSIQHCTIAFNHSSGVTTTVAGGIHVSSPTANGTAKNSILWQNYASDGSALQVSQPTASSFSVIYSDVEGGYVGTGNTSVDPHFIGAADLHLQDSSPCINAAGAPSESMSDVDGDPRVYYGTADVGADEYVGQALMGNVGASIGGPFEYLFVNGSSGGGAHRILVPGYSPIAVTMLQPPFNPIPSSFILWGFIGAPGVADQYPTPIGTLAFTPFHVDPLRPGLFCLANNLFPDPDAKVASSPAPWTSVIGQLPYPYIFTVQGLIIDYTSATTDFGFTNAVIIETLQP